MDRNSTIIVYLVLTLSIIFFSPSVFDVWEHVNYSGIVNDDANQYIPPFFSYLPNDAPSLTYADRYYLDAVAPFGYKWMYILSAKYWDPVALSRWLPYVLLFITIAVIFLCAKEISGSVIALSTIIIMLAFSANIMMMLGFIGGTPRSFAFPIIAISAYALIKEKPLLLAVATFFSTQCYPIVGLISGLSLTTMLFLNKRYRPTTHAWSIRKRITLIATTALISLLLLLPQISSRADYGKNILPNQITAFPEAGEEGRYFRGDYLPHEYETEWLSEYFIRSFEKNGALLFADNESSYARIVGIIFLIFSLTSIFSLISMIVGFQKNIKEDTEKTVRLLLLFPVSLLLFSLSYLLQPYLFMPNRYLMYTIPVLATLLLPFSLNRVISKSRYKNISPAISLLILFTLTVFCGGRGYGVAKSYPGEDVRLVIDAVSELDNNVLVAGWPNDNAMGLMQYGSRRNAFLTFQTHQSILDKFTLEMRGRMQIFIPAYFATDTEDLKKLVKKYRVTHLIINKNHFDFDEPPSYFAGFEEELNKITDEVRSKSIFANRDNLAHAVIFQHGRYTLYDLDKLVMN